MARIAGVDIPNEKNIGISLTYIYGIGRPTAAKILAEAGDKEEVISCEIDLADIDKVRNRLNALADVRKELIQ